MKTLLFGAEGQLGQAFAESLDCIRQNRHLTDIADTQAVLDALERERPDVIINAAAYTAVDKAESDVDLAFAVNATAVATMANWARDNNVRLLHYSTDYVFDGLASQPYTEADAPNPLNVYGDSKLAGDAAVLAAGGQGYVFRTSWVYSTRRANFLKTMLRLGREKDSMSVVCDQVGVPTSTDFLVEVAKHFLQGDFEPGLYNTVPNGQTTWHEYAVHVLRVAEGAGVSLKTRPEGVRPISTCEYPMAARRPAYSVLSPKKLESVLGSLPDWRPAVTKTVLELVQ